MTRPACEARAVGCAPANLMMPGRPVPIGRAGRKLAGEAARYLSAVDTFRAEGSEPTWRAERTS